MPAKQAGIFLKKYPDVLNRLPGRGIHKSFIGGPAAGSTLLALRAVQAALHGNDRGLRNLAELTPPVT